MESANLFRLRAEILRGAYFSPTAGQTGTLSGLSTPSFFLALSFEAKSPATLWGAGTSEPPSRYGAVDRSIKSGVPFWEGRGLFLTGGSASGIDRAHRDGVPLHEKL